MAPGNQKWNGTRADLETAPTRASATATCTAVVGAGGFATISLSSGEPDVRCRITRPASIARPPNVVTSSAFMAARRLARRSGLCPTSRYDSTVVSSQNT